MPTSGRKDWIQADLRCLMCGRVLGRLVGPATGRPNTTRLAGRYGPRFAAFRPADDRASAVRLVGGEHFRCTTCHGAVIVDEVEVFSTYGQPGDDDQERPRRGRPPKPWRSPPTTPTWLDELGIAG